MISCTMLRTFPFPCVAEINYIDTKKLFNFDPFVFWWIVILAAQFELNRVLFFSNCWYSYQDFNSGQLHIKKRTQHCTFKVSLGQLFGIFKEVQYTKIFDNSRVMISVRTWWLKMSCKFGIGGHIFFIVVITSVYLVVGKKGLCER